MVWTVVVVVVAAKVEAVVIVVVVTKVEVEVVVVVVVVVSAILTKKHFRDFRQSPNSELMAASLMIPTAGGKPSWGLVYRWAIPLTLSISFDDIVAPLMATVIII